MLEDLHWADEATLDVFRLLARRVETVPALVVATYRDDELDVCRPAAHRARGAGDEPVDQPDEARSAFRRVAVAALAEPYGVDADELYDKTAGNPFFVVEALAAGAEAIPETVRDAVLARAARLGPSGHARSSRRSRSCRPQPSSGCSGRSPREPLDGLDECLASGMLRSDPVGIAFRHELARMAVEESVAPQPEAGAPPARRSRRWPIRRPARRTSARLAHHAEAAGDADAVLRYAPAAAARAAAARRPPRGRRAVRARTAVRRRSLAGASARICSICGRSSAT